MNFLPAQDMADAVSRYFAGAAQARAWTVESTMDWAAADAGRLTEGQRSAVEFVTVIEEKWLGQRRLH